MSSTRKFGDKVYTYHNAYGTKGEAQHSAEGCRTHGRKARVVRAGKTTHPYKVGKPWLVFARGK